MVSFLGLGHFSPGAQASLNEDAKAKNAYEHYPPQAPIYTSCPPAFAVNLHDWDKAEATVQAVRYEVLPALDEGSQACGPSGQPRLDSHKLLHQLRAGRLAHPNLSIPDAGNLHGYDLQNLKEKAAASDKKVVVIGCADAFGGITHAGENRCKGSNEGNWMIYEPKGWSVHKKN